MNKKTKIIAGVILIFLIATIAIGAALRQPNDYFAFVGQINNIETSGIDDNALNVTYITYYIPMTASPTYTLTLRPLTTSINISQPSQINNKIVATITNESIKMGYNLKKVIMQNYNVVNP